MKRILLITTLSLFILVSHAQRAQRYTFKSNCSLPAGFSLSQGSKVGPFDNPKINGCSDGNSTDDCGIITPGVGGNNPANIITPPSDYYSPTIDICFDIFVFDANLKCSSAKPFDCPTKVTLYIVDATYDDTKAPTEYYGMSEPVLVNANVTNCLSVHFNNGPIPGKEYRIFIDFTAENCNQQNTKYVIDFLSISDKQQSPLPVAFKSFTASRNKDAVTLSWETASEQNNKGFGIQLNSGAGWQDVAFVSTKADGGNSASVIEYSYVDLNKAKGLSQYRLKQVDVDAKIKYSEIRTVRNTDVAGKPIISPNPTNSGTVMVTFDDMTTARDVFILDVNGKIIQQWKGLNKSNLQISGLHKGMYLLQVISKQDGSQAYEKVLVN